MKKKDSLFRTIEESFYYIHNRIPVGDEALPGDGLMFFPDIELPEEKRAKPCRCEKCNAVREAYYKRVEDKGYKPNRI